MRFFQTINDGLSLLIPIHSCSKWKTNWPISEKCSKAKIICRCHLQNQPYLEKCLCYKHDLGVILTGGNWQKWKRVFLTCPCHEIYRDEAVGLKSCKYTWKITKFVKMGNLGQYRENLIFCQ